MLIENQIREQNTAVHHLEEVFSAFNKVSSDLEHSYRELEGKVNVLSEELSATRSERLKELTAKEKLASKLSALMDALPGGVIAVDHEGYVCEENQTAITLLGKSILGTLWHETLNDITTESPVFQGELSLNNGKRISLTSSHYGENNTIILLTDVSENYQLNNRLNREKRLSALGEMSARLAHQIRTPLSSAVLYLSHLNPKNDSDINQETVKKIHKRLGQIESMIDSMLSYVKEEMYEAKEFSLTETIKDIYESMTPKVHLYKGEIQIVLPEKEYSFTGNKEGLQNAISNLIENAIQSSHNSPHIVLRLNHYKDWFDISVSDNGSGIPDEIKEKIFDPFFTTKSKGTGLGLAVVSSVVKAHGGEIVIRDNKDCGSVFHILIPKDDIKKDLQTGIWNSKVNQNEKDSIQELCNE